MEYQYIPQYIQTPQYAYQQPAGQLEQLRSAQQYPAQQSGTGITWVQGEEGAKAYMVAPGASVLLMDSESQAFYIKSADNSGMPMPLRVFDYVERGTSYRKPGSETKSQKYVTWEDFSELKRQFDELRMEGMNYEKPIIPAAKRKQEYDATASVREIYE